MQYEDFVRSYEGKSEEELLRLQLDAKDLTPEATVALTNELAKRRINSTTRLDAFRNDEQQRKEEESRKPGNLFMHFRLGVGRWYLGKANRTFNPSTGMERFKTTIFILLFWLPIIPTGSYLVERKRGAFATKITVLKKLPLDWEQILKVWVIAAACLLVLVLVLKRM